MLKEIPSGEVLISHLGSTAITAWNAIGDFIDQNYNIESFWDNGGKYGEYVLRFKKSGKTLCTLYVRDKRFGCWIIFGKAERDRFEQERNSFVEEIQIIYDTTPVFHDGKWVMLEIADIHLVEDIKKMLFIKKKPNKK